MKKYIAICGTLLALAWVGVAAAATPQGKLTGSAVFGSTTLAITSTVTDGGTSYVGLENDKSGNCNGDSGTISVNGTPRNVVCAHFVASSRCCSMGSPKMRFAYDIGGGLYLMARITDNGASTDTYAASSGIATSLAEARAWVNKGAIGGGGGSWIFVAVTSGNWTVAP